MKIADFDLSKKKTFVIAEIGGNHEGDFSRALQMIQEAAKAGADAVKFQILRGETLVHCSSNIPAYSGISHAEQLQRFKKREFTIAQYRQLKKAADRTGIVFLASVFDEKLVDAMDSLLPAYKIASGDMTHYQLLRHIQRKRKPIILSTGASTWKEIDAVVRFLGKNNIALLHCVCAYPAPYKEMNLSVIPAMRKRYRIPVGFSDHTIGIDCAIASIALGAVIIEKHFTLTPNNPIGDHKLSVTPEQLAAMVTAIRVVEDAMGTSDRTVYECEKRARPLVRRSFYAIRDIPKGEPLNHTNIAALRPLSGVLAEDWKKISGRKAKRKFSKGSPLFLR